MSTSTKPGTADNPIEVDLDNPNWEKAAEEMTNRVADIIDPDDKLLGGERFTDETPEPGSGLFDASDYDREDLAIPKVDGEQIDKIRFAFSGSVLLDRSEVADVALFNGARLGKELELRISAKVAGVGTGFTTNKDGDLDVIVGEKNLKVESVWVLDPEEL